MGGITSRFSHPFPLAKRVLHGTPIQSNTIYCYFCPLCVYTFIFPVHQIGPPINVMSLCIL